MMTQNDVRNRAFRFIDDPHTRWAHDQAEWGALQAASGAQNVRGQSWRVTLHTVWLPISPKHLDSFHGLADVAWNPAVPSTEPSACKKGLHIQTAIFRGRRVMLTESSGLGFVSKAEATVMGRDTSPNSMVPQAPEQNFIF